MKRQSDYTELSEPNFPEQHPLAAKTGASALRMARRRILGAWVQKMMTDSPLRVLESLSLAELQGEMPFLLDALQSALERQGTLSEGPAASELQRRIHDHMTLRQHQGFAVHDFVTECGLLRQEIFEAMTRRLQQRGVEPVSAMKTLAELDARIDELASMGTEIFHEHSITELAEAATRDSLTGLHNRAVFSRQLAEELAKSQRLGYPLSLLMADLDHFKDYNDRLGHAAGDRILQLASQILLEAARATDTVSRLGGDEFCVLLPGADKGGARAAAQRILREAGRRRKLMGNVSFSVGVATYPQDGASAGELMESADRAMYEAKRQGRNRVASG